MDLSTLTTSGAYFYPGDLETLSERKFADFGRKKMTAARDSPWLLPQALTDSKKSRQREPMGGFLRAVCSAYVVNIYSGVYKHP